VAPRQHDAVGVVVTRDPAELVAAGSWSVKFGASRLVYADGALARLGELTRELGCRRVLLVTDAGLRAAGHVDTAIKALEREAVMVEVFDDVDTNPTTAHVDSGVTRARGMQADGLIALGGGSPMDCAKGINFLFNNPGRMEDYRGYGKATQPFLPSIGVPTTAGTGSDAQSYALISQQGSGVKMACGDPQASFSAVVFDPLLMATTPRGVAAVAGIDAMSHAIESYVCTRRNPLSQLMGREAWTSLNAAFPELLRVAGSATPAACHGRMLLGAFLAGSAIELAMLGAAHALANPLTARYGVVHGTAVGLMLPHVMEFNRVDVAAVYDELAPNLLETFRRHRADAGLPERLSECGVARENLDRMAGEAAAQWTAGFNPRPVGSKELRELYERAY